MSRAFARALAVVVVATLVALAGCGAGGDDGSTTASTDQPTATPTLAMADETTESPTAMGGGATAPGTTSPTPQTTTGTSSTPESVANETVHVFANHADAVESAGGYVATAVFNTTGVEGEAANVSLTLQVDFAADSMRQIMAVESGDRPVTLDFYRPPGNDSVVFCTKSGGQCLRTQTVSRSQATQRGLENLTSPRNATATGGPGEYEFTDKGIVSTDAGDRHRYTIDSVEQLPEAARSTEQGELTEISIEVYVNPDTDRITRYDYAATFDTEDGEMTTEMRLRYEAFGTGLVEVPDWYDSE